MLVTNQRIVGLSDEDSTSHERTELETPGRAFFVGLQIRGSHNQMVGYYHMSTTAGKIPAVQVASYLL